MTDEQLTRLFYQLLKTVPLPVLASALPYAVDRTPLGKGPEAITLAYEMSKNAAAMLMQEVRRLDQPRFSGITMPDVMSGPDMTNVKMLHARWEAPRPGLKAELESSADRGLRKLKDQGYTIGSRIVDTEICIKYEVWRESDTSEKS